MVANLQKCADIGKRDRLKASKKAWNLTVRLLRVKLKAFQKSINGHGDADAQLPEVSLKDPFPVEFRTYLSSIVDDYDKVLKGADFIMNLQDDFSTTRRKSQRELRELSAAIDTYDQKIAEASWWGSRAWAWFALHKLGKDARRARLRMLGLCSKSIDALNIIEYSFTSKSPGSDVRAIVGLTRFINLFIGGYLVRLEQLRQIDLRGLEDPEAPQLPEGPGEPKEAPQPGTEGIGKTVVSGPPPGAKPNIRAKVLADLDARNKLIQNSSYNSNEKKRLNGLYNALSKGVIGKNKLSDEDFEDQHDLLVKLLEEAESKVSNAQTEEEEYRKIAQNVIQRWWSRKRLNRNNLSDDLKLQISDEILDAIRKFKELMDIIESLDRSTADISDKTKEISIMLKSAAEKTIQFADNYRMEWRLEQDPKKRPARLEEGITSKLKKLISML